MNIFSKFFLITLGILIGGAGVLQLQDIALKLLSAPNDGSFYLGLFYLAIVIFIWGTAVYFTADYLIKLIVQKESSKTEQEVSNEQKPNN